MAMTEKQKTHMKVVYFGELDLCFGSFPQNKDALPTLVSILKFLCLAYDRVLIQSSAIFQHSLALPALEALAPFVRDGRLGTSADHNAPHPALHFQNRIEEYVSQHSSSTAQGQRKRDDLQRLLERWQVILPEYWPMRRSVVGQVDGSQAQVLRHLEQARGGPYQQAAEQMYRHLMELLSKDVALRRMPLLRSVVEMRGSAKPADIAYASMLVQNAYFSIGAKSHNSRHSTCYVYPGAIYGRVRSDFWKRTGIELDISFARNLRNYELNKSLKLDWKIDLESLLRLPPDDCVQLCNHEKWPRIAKILRGEASLSPYKEDFAALFGQGDIRDFVEKIPELGFEQLQFADTTCLLRWTGLIQAILSTSSLEKDTVIKPKKSKFRFDWGSRVLSVTDGVPSKNHDCFDKVLSPQQAHLFTVLAVAGEFGAEDALLKQTLRELDAGFPLEPVNTKGVQTRLDTAKHRLRVTLDEFGLNVETRNERVYLKPHHIEMVNTPWCYEPEKRPDFQEPDLPPVPLKAWRLLHRYFPLEANIEVLAQAFDRHDENRKRYISRVINELKKRLEENESDWLVHNDQQGNYRLMRRSETTP